ncbi:unnamed protein product [Amoebophrya sp. A25]|nr:unnamed protein product [Amoebophrya sp. A25]|eukprot:GSA25T00010367001.1
MLDIENHEVDFLQFIDIVTLVLYLYRECMAKEAAISCAHLCCSCFLPPITILYHPHPCFSFSFLFKFLFLNQARALAESAFSCEGLGFVFTRRYVDRRTRKVSLS